MHLRRFPRGASAAAAIALACACAARPLAAQAPAAATTAPAAPAAPTVPVSATSQCVEGPGAPPADPTKVTRVVPGAPSAPGASAPGAAKPGHAGPAPVLLELGAVAGVSVRFDDVPALETERREGLVLGGSLFVWTSRSLAFGVGYSHAELGRSESSPLSVATFHVDHAAHSLVAEARVSPFHFESVSLFASIGGGLVWQTAALAATFPPLDGAPAASFTCSVGSGAEFGFRAGLGAKAPLTGSLSFLADASFMGYRFSSDVLGACAPGAGTAQTVMIRAGFTYDVDVSRLVR